MNETQTRSANVLRVRRAALGAIIAQGGVPTPAQFVRAGLPPLVRASALIPADAEDCHRVTPLETQLAKQVEWERREAAACRRKRLAGPPV